MTLHCSARPPLEMGISCDAQKLGSAVRLNHPGEAYPAPSRAVARPAGLAAAAALTDRCFRVALLEARERIGGRAYTVDAPGMSRPVELGPEFIHGMPDVTSCMSLPVYAAYCFLPLLQGTAK